MNCKLCLALPEITALFQAVFISLPVERDVQSLGLNHFCGFISWVQPSWLCAYVTDNLDSHSVCGDRVNTHTAVLQAFLKRDEPLFAFISQQFHGSVIFCDKRLTFFFISLTDEFSWKAELVQTFVNTATNIVLSLPTAHSGKNPLKWKPML